MIALCVHYSMLLLCLFCCCCVGIFKIRDIDMAEFLSSDPAVQDAHPHTVYDLMASICHSGQAGSGKGTYHVHIRHKASYTMHACSLETH